jgi:type IV pilus assembly protein PilE
MMAPVMHPPTGGARSRFPLGFTLLEVLVALVIGAIVVAIALPSYRAQVQRASREAVQAQLVELAALQERIFLGSNAYSSNISAAYDGTATGGLGVTTGMSADGRYTLTVSVSGASHTLTATPVTGSTQAGDGTLTITSAGSRTWGSKTW